MKTTHLLLLLALTFSQTHVAYASEGIDIPQDPALAQPAPDAEFELMGTIAGESPVACFVFPDTGIQRLARVHEMVGRYSVASITPGQVLLVKDGIHYELRMSNARTVDLAKADAEDSGTPSEQVPVQSTQAYTLSRTNLLKQAVTANELLKQVSVRPIRGQENKIHGYFIDQVPPGSILDEAGICNGDVIVSIEGREIGSMQDAWSAFNAIKGRSFFEIVLLRNNQPVTVRYSLTN